MRVRMRRRAVALGSVLALALAAALVHTDVTPASVASRWTVTGPAANSPTAAQVSLSGGVLTFSVSTKGTTVLYPSVIGIVTSAADLTQDLTFTKRADRTIVEAYRMTTGKQLSQSLVYTETTLSFTGTGGARLDVVVRASDTGVAYRYVLPGNGLVTVQREASSWTVPTGSNAWLVPSSREDQGIWFQTTAGGAASDDYRVPGLFQVGGAYALVAETDLDGRYAAMYLAHRAGSGTYTTALASWITTTLPLRTPWRTAAVGDLKTVTGSTIVDDLAAPSKVADTSWIKPGKVAWSWLTDNASPANENRQRQYIDFAQRNGWEYVLIDAGWSSSWAPAVVAYANARNVQVILWFNAEDLDTAQQRENWLPLVKSWGVAGVKVDFSYEYTQPTLQWYDAILGRTAELKLMINFHGTATARGLQRTWPQVMSSEAVYGAEQKLRASFNTIVPFTRNAISSMDFTPVIFSPYNRDTTPAHELATAIVFESGWQHLADSIESYQAHPEALGILDQLPTVWDETRLLGGKPGQEAYFARRNGRKWFIGGISALAAKTYSTPLSFLGTGQWFVETVRDGSSGLVRETEVVTNADTLSVPIGQRGGFAAVACHYTVGMSTCVGAGSGGNQKWASN